MLLECLVVPIMMHGWIRACSLKVFLISRCFNSLPQSQISESPWFLYGGYGRDGYLGPHMVTISMSFLHISGSTGASQENWTTSRVVSSALAAVGLWRLVKFRPCWSSHQQQKIWRLHGNIGWEYHAPKMGGEVSSHPLLISCTSP